MGSPIGLWTAVSGGMAQSQNLDIIANNLANANTTGFKKDSADFKQYLTAIERPPSPAIDIPRTAFKDSDFYHFDGRENVMVNLDSVHTDHSQGTLRPTSGPFDLAIDGPGMFAVQTPAGIMYTRSGDFKVDGTGMLVTTDGYPVLALAGEAAEAKQAATDAALQAAEGGEQAQNAPKTSRSPASVNPFTNPQGLDGKPVLQPVQLRAALANGDKLHIAPGGEIYTGDQLVGVLAVAEFTNPAGLKKVTSALYANPNAANVPTTASVSKVKQGFLEASNVNPVSELVEMLKANRLYEQNMRAIKAYNDMSGKEANEVGKL